MNGARIRSINTFISDTGQLARNLSTTARRAPPPALPPEPTPVHRCIRPYSNLKRVFVLASVDGSIAVCPHQTAAFTNYLLIISSNRLSLTKKTSKRIQLSEIRAFSMGLHFISSIIIFFSGQQHFASALSTATVLGSSYPCNICRVWCGVLREYCI